MITSISNNNRFAKHFMHTIHRIRLSNINQMSTMDSNTKTMEDILPDFPPGPLQEYRKKASFDWKKLKLAIYGEENLRYIDYMYSIFKSNPIFDLSRESLPLDEQRLLAQRRMKILKEKNLLPLMKIVENPQIVATYIEAIFTYDCNTAIRLGLTYGMFINVMQGLGTDRHYKFIEAAENAEITGCFALTEIAHGSNAKGMRTTATYDIKNKSFVLNSANFEAAKCWVGTLGKCATHGIVYAKLITPDGTNHGLHPFVVPIRCTRTLKPFAGVIVGDLGEKIALNGVDNGFVMFNNYHIPKENLLNKLGDVDDNGNYVSPIKDPNRRFGASLGVLSNGRVQIAGMATNNLQKAIAIAVRYSAVRKQFGPDNSDEEFPVIEYQQQQFRLFPYVAAVYGMRIFSNWLSEVLMIFSISSVTTAGDPETKALKGMELHALSSAAKPIIAWIARDGIQICREACGGHGYLKAAGIGDIRNENDANCTYEGENSVLIQQTSNWLLSLWKKIQQGNKIQTPYDTATFLNDYKNIMASNVQTKMQNSITLPVILSAFKWLICHTLMLTANKADKLRTQGKDNFTVRNETQAYHAATLSILYAEHAIVKTFSDFNDKVEDPNVKRILSKLSTLLGAWLLEKHLATLYMGKFFTDDAGLRIRENIVDLCAELKDNAVSLVDTLAPPDFILNSVLGSSDGNLYQNLQSNIFSAPGALERPNWWQEVVNWKVNMPSKI